MAVFNAEREDRLEEGNFVVTTWTVPRCKIESCCYCHTNSPDKPILRCTYFKYVDKEGLHCNRPNSIHFLEEIADGI